MMILMIKNDNNDDDNIDDEDNDDDNDGHIEDNDVECSRW
jgi:hypothetical protein